MTLDRSLPFSIKADFSNSSWSDSGLVHRVGDTSQKSNPWAACIPAAFNHLGVHTHLIASFLFYFLLSNLDSFFSFACLTALTRTSSTVLNGSDKSRHPWFVPDRSCPQCQRWARNVLISPRFYYYVSFYITLTNSTLRWLPKEVLLSMSNSRCTVLVSIPSSLFCLKAILRGSVQRRKDELRGLDIVLYLIQVLERLF